MVKLKFVSPEFQIALNKKSFSTKSPKRRRKTAIQNPILGIPPIVLGFSTGPWSVCP